MAGPKQRKIAIVGSRAVGKSSMTVQFVDGHFVESYYPTIENTFSKVIRYKNQDYATEIIDTAGQVRCSPYVTGRTISLTAPQQDEYSILNSKHFIGIHGYMIVYSVANKQSFEMARIIRDKILNHLVSHVHHDRAKESKRLKSSCPSALSARSGATNTFSFRPLNTSPSSL